MKFLRFLESQHYLQTARFHQVISLLLYVLLMKIVGCKIMIKSNLFLYSFSTVSFNRQCVLPHPERPMINVYSGLFIYIVRRNLVLNTA